jgi:hypothetical protein
MIQRLVVLRRLLVILILRLVVLILRLVVLILRLVILILRRLPELLLELLELLELELNLRFKHRMNPQTPPFLPLRLLLPELLLRLVPNTVPPSLRSESLLLRLRLEVLSLVLNVMPLVFLRLRSELHPHPL